MSAKDGGPAFPHQDAGDTGTRPGMTLRDYFAAKAFPLIMEKLYAELKEKYQRVADETTVYKVAAAASYEAADAMLAARGDI